ncbi:MAG: L-threonylcarbamoyladenylate synthase [Candidatus Niyogibacteria bacterium]|nr:L-threonylcarbamoyladenylate synthase [Candidatus Niyogibacteria bacterium]
MEIFAINDSNINEAVERAAALLRVHEVIALPTDTVYGLAADARSEAAVEKVFALRAYPKNTPARAMSQFSSSQGTTTRLYQEVRREGVTKDGRKVAIARRVAAFFPSRFVTPRSQYLGYSFLGKPRGDDKNARNAGWDIFGVGSQGRATEKALPIFVSSAEMLDEVAYVRDARIGEFLAAVWPGAVTAVLPARGWLPLSLRGGSLTIAMRIPDNFFVQKVIEKFGGPITGTSANLSGHPACLTAADVEREFKHLPLTPAALFSNGGASAGTSSTIVDCTAFPPKILRVGAVSEGDIMELVNKCAIK